jgi:hypothetical protein
MAERYSGADGFANGSARAGGGGFGPDYMESDATGDGFALSYKGRSSTDTRGELGARFDHACRRGRMTANGAGLPRQLRGDGSGFEGTFAFRCCSYRAVEVWCSKPRELIAALSGP